MKRWRNQFLFSQIAMLISIIHVFIFLLEYLYMSSARVNELTDNVE